MDTVVINLDRDVSKYETILKTCPWPVTRVAAVDGSALPDVPSHLNPFMYGCLLSHRKVWEYASRQDHPVLVLEDDCVFGDAFAENLTHYLKTLPPDVDVAVVGYIASDVTLDVLLTAFATPIMKRRPLQKVNDQWWIPGVFMGTHCYLVSPQGARKLCANTDLYHADAVICRDASLALYCANRPLASQSQRVGVHPYNGQITWEWILAEPVYAIRNRPIRVIHLLVLYIVIVLCFFRSDRPALRLAGRCTLALPLMHYMGTYGHIVHSMRNVPHDTQDTTDTEWSVKMNDNFALATFLVLAYTAHRQHKFTRVMDAALVATMVKMAMSAAIYMPDPSRGKCEQRSLRRYGLFDYCGNLMPSGHVIPSLLLVQLNPLLGIFTFTAQVFLTLKNQLHYPLDVMVSIGLIFTFFNV